MDTGTWCGQWCWRGACALLLSLLVVSGVQAQTGGLFGRNKVQYEDFEWHVLETDHFDIYYYPEMEELAEHGAHFAEEAYDELRHRFDFALNKRVPLIFYSSNIHFKQTNITPGFIPDGVGGFFEFMKGRVVVPANGNLHRFRRVIRHELVHVFTFSRVMRVLKDHRVPPDRFLPLWFTEGLAEYWSGPPDHQHEMIMRDALLTNYLVPLENIYRIQGTFIMYKQGEAICRFIAETYGEERLLQLVDNVWKSRDFRDVMESTLQEPFLTVSDRWLTWLRQEYYPRFEDTAPPTRLAHGVANRGFNAKPAFYHGHDGTRRVFYTANQMGYTNLYAVEVDSAYQPVRPAEVLIRGERSERYEAFHLFESRISISEGGLLAFVTKSGSQDVLHVYDLEADAPGPTYRFSDLVAVYSPTWSPGGTALAFSAIDRSGFADLYLYDRNAEHLRKLTHDAYDDRDPAWSPDGRYLAFASDRTVWGEEGAYNLFTYDLTTQRIQYVTVGRHQDFSPRWRPDGRALVFTSARPDSTGRYGGQDVWTVDVDAPLPDPPPVASADPQRLAPPVEALVPPARQARRLTTLTTAAFDPVWTADQRLVFTSFEGLRFTIRSLEAVDSLEAFPQALQAVAPAPAHAPWAFARTEQDDGAVQRSPYKRRYDLDLAQGSVGQDPLWGTTGGAVLAFSDLMGNDYWYATVFNTAQTRGDLLRSLNVALSRVQLHRRANVGYGLFRYGGRRYDLRDPDAARTFPLFWESVYGGYGAVSYPVSFFKRVELSTSLSWSDKEVPFTNVRRQALLLSNAASLVHDNALYGMNGPVQGWRGNLTLGYTTDIRYSNVSYVTLRADVRRYLRLAPRITWASRALGQINHGREARLFLLGGSWDLRGFPLYDVRAPKMWFTSHELRFPLLDAPSAYVPILAPFGIANLRGALFFDAAHVWDEGYRVRRPSLYLGETLGATGAGLRMNLFGGFVLRYDIGYRYRDGFRDRSDRLFKQFFFGWDF
ncbi:MAG: BamA/TamA family outer membrane protein [Bacteroidota bacterium]